MKKGYDSIIFDMDGVLVDESKSYRIAIEKTVNYYLSKKQITLRTNKGEIRLIKCIPNFNNDWDVSFVLATILQEGLKVKNYINKIKPINESTRKSEKYVKIKDIFQSYYLGNRLYRKIYNRKPSIGNKFGLIKNDKLLIKEDLLEALSKKYKLGVVTSRPRFEAIYGLRSLKIVPKYIKESEVVAKEDCPKEKPAPDPIILLINRMGLNSPIYIGDTINDTIAARKAGIKCIFIGNQKLGDYQVNNIQKIRDMLL